MLHVLAIVLGLWAGIAQASPLSDEHVDTFLSFAHVVSSGDVTVMERAGDLVAAPPSTREDIGFYGLEDAPDAERALRGIIRVLADAGYLVTVEDKYAYELPAVLVQNGMAEGDTTRAELDLTAAFTSEDDDFFDEVFWAEFRAGFPAHTRAIEAAVERSGKRLLSVQLPLGDTLYFWAADVEDAAVWQGRGLYVGPNTTSDPRRLLSTFLVTAPDWETYWGFMTYALFVPEPFWATPDGL